jgi:predicted molibdopterin-dependent oxidoreductase YjgC
MVGADPVRDVPNGALAARALDSAEFTVALDLFLTDSSSRADVVFPAETFAEKEGTTTNVEGRVQKVARIVAGPGQTQADWSILEEIARRMGAPMGFQDAASVSAEIARVAPAYTGIGWGDLFGDGVVVPREGVEQPLRYQPVDHQMASVSAPFVLHLARTLYDDGVEMRHSLSLHNLAPGARVYLHPADAATLGVAEGDEVTVETASGAASASATFDASLVRGVVYVPFNQPGMSSLGDEVEVTVRKGVSG